MYTFATHINIHFRPPLVLGLSHDCGWWALKESNLITAKSGVSSFRNFDKIIEKVKGEKPKRANLSLSDGGGMLGTVLLLPLDALFVETNFKDCATGEECKAAFEEWGRCGGGERARGGTDEVNDGLD